MSRYNNEEDNRQMIPASMRMVFGIIMIIVYVGMGVLMLMNFFQWNGPVLQWMRWVLGTVFVIYGIWRAIRQFKGLDTSL